MTDKNEIRETTATVLKEFEDGCKILSVPNLCHAKMVEDNSVVVHTTPDGGIDHVILTVSRPQLEKYAAWMEKHGVISRMPSSEELDMVIRTIASSMHVLVDEFIAKTGSELTDRLGVDMLNIDNLESTIKSAMFDAILKRAKFQRGLRPSDEVSVSHKIRDLIDDRLDLQGSMVDGFADLADALKSGDLRDRDEIFKDHKNLMNEILDEVLPDSDPVGITINVVLRRVPNDVPSETRRGFALAIEEVVQKAHDEEDENIIENVLQTFDKFGIEHGIVEDDD